MCAASPAIMCSAGASEPYRRLDLPEQHATSPSKPVSTRDPGFHSQVNAVVTGRHSDPFAFLGPHPAEGGCAVRFFLPWANQARICFQAAASESSPSSSATVVEAERLR